MKYPKEIRHRQQAEDGSGESASLDFYPDPEGWAKDAGFPFAGGPASHKELFKEIARRYNVHQNLVDALEKLINTANNNAGKVPFMDIREAKTTLALAKSPE